MKTKAIIFYTTTNKERFNLYLHVDKKVLKSKIENYWVGLPLTLCTIGIIVFPTNVIMGNNIGWNIIFSILCASVLYWMYNVVKKNNIKKISDQKWEEVFSH